MHPGSAVRRAGFLHIDLRRHFVVDRQAQLVAQHAQIRLLFSRADHHQMSLRAGRRIEKAPIGPDQYRQVLLGQKAAQAQEIPVRQIVSLPELRGPRAGFGCATGEEVVVDRVVAHENVVAVHAQGFDVLHLRAAADQRGVEQADQTAFEPGAEAARLHGALVAVDHEHGAYSERSCRQQRRQRLFRRVARNEQHIEFELREAFSSSKKHAPEGQLLGHVAREQCDQIDRGARSAPFIIMRTAGDFQGVNRLRRGVGFQRGYTGEVVGTILSPQHAERGHGRCSFGDRSGGEVREFGADGARKRNRPPCIVGYHYLFKHFSPLVATRLRPRARAQRTCAQSIMRRRLPTELKFFQWHPRHHGPLALGRLRGRGLPGPLREVNLDQARRSFAPSETAVS